MRAERVPGRVLARGRRRAAARVNAGHFAPHPGWRNFIPAGRRVLVDQAAARERVEQLLAGESWRADRLQAWRLMLLALVYAMDWTTGLVCGLTATEIAAAGSRSTRTVTDVIRWAVEGGLLVVVEPGASAAFLGTQHGRTPTYAFLADPAEPQQPSSDRSPDQADHELCDLSQVPVGKQPLLRGRRLDEPRPLSWPGWQIPETPSQRNAAAAALSRRIGLDRPGVAGWRLRALLERGGWWHEGWCVAGLLYALDHHPDHPDQPRGDALRSADDPIRVLGHRLRPWRGRLAKLPAHLHGLRGDYQLAQAQRLAARLDDPPNPPAVGDGPATDPPAAASARAAARALLADHLAQLRQRRIHQQPSRAGAQRAMAVPNRLGPRVSSFHFPMPSSVIVRRR